MRILYLTLNRHAAELIRTTLGGANILMSIAADFEQVLRLPSQNFSVVIVDKQLYGTSGLEVINRLRLAGYLTNATFWYCDHERNEHNPDVQDMMQQLNAVRYFRKPLSALDVKSALRAMSAAQEPNIVPSTLRMVAQIWASKSSVLVQTAQAKVFFSSGAIVHQDPDNGLEEILKEAVPRLIYTDIQGSGDWLATGRLLKRNALKPTESWLMSHHSKAIRISAFEQAVVSLGLSETLSKRRFKSGESRLNEWAPEAQQEAYMLWMMGFIAFEEPKAERQSASGQSQAVHTRNPVLLLQRLKDEWERIEHAEPWIVLGLSQTASGALIADTVERLEQRYQEIVEAPYMRDEIRQIAGQIQAHIHQSAETWQHTSDDGRQPEHIRLLNVAKQLFQQGEFYKSEHLLKRASKLVMDNSDINAWYGWAILHNPERSDESKKEDALDALLLAISTDPNNPNALLFLTQYYRRMNQSEQALSPATQLQRINPSKDTEALIALIHKEIRAQSHHSS